MHLEVTDIDEATTNIQTQLEYSQQAFVTPEDGQSAKPPVPVKKEMAEAPVQVDVLMTEREGPDGSGSRQPARAAGDGLTGDSFSLRQQIIDTDTTNSADPGSERQAGEPSTSEPARPAGEEVFDECQRGSQDEGHRRGSEDKRRTSILGIPMPRVSEDGFDLWTGSTAPTRKKSVVLGKALLPDENPGWGAASLGCSERVWHFLHVLNERTVFEPDSRIKSKWDWILLVLVLYVSVWVPLTVGMNIVESGCSAADGTRCYASFFSIFDWVVDLVFWLDMFCSVRMGFYNRDGVPNTDPLSCAKNYLYSIWFPIDFVASFPFDRVAEAITGEKADRVLRLQRLPKLLRLGRLRKKFDDLAQGYLLRIFFYLTVYMLLAHTLACGMFMLGTAQTPSFEEMCEAEQGYQAGESPKSWVVVAGIGCDTALMAQYTQSLYFILTTLSTVGYGDFSPVTDEERWAVMLCFLIGLVGNGIMLGNIAAVIQTAEVHARVHREWMHNINVLIKSQGLPSELAFQLRNHAQFYNLISQGLDIYKTLEGMPLHVQEGVLMHIHASVVKNVALWRVAKEDEGFCRAIVTRLKTENVLPQEWLMQEGDATFHMYFVLSGKTSAHTKKMGQLATIGVGGYFGELSTISGCRRVASVKAEEHCHLAALTREAFLEVIAAYPEYEHSVLEAAERKVIKWKLLDDDNYEQQQRIADTIARSRTIDPNRDGSRRNSLVSNVSIPDDDLTSQHSGSVLIHSGFQNLPGEVEAQAEGTASKANSQIYNSIRQSLLGGIHASAGPAGLQRSKSMPHGLDDASVQSRLRSTSITRLAADGQTGPRLQRSDSQGTERSELLSRLSGIRTRENSAVSGMAAQASGGLQQVSPQALPSPSELPGRTVNTRDQVRGGGRRGSDGTSGRMDRPRSNSVSFADDLRRDRRHSQASIEEEEAEGAAGRGEEAAWTPGGTSGRRVSITLPGDVAYYPDKQRSSAKKADPLTPGQHSAGGGGGGEDRRLSYPAQRSPEPTPRSPGRDKASSVRKASSLQRGTPADHPRDVSTHVAPESNTGAGESPVSPGSVTSPFTPEASGGAGPYGRVRYSSLEKLRMQAYTRAAARDGEDGGAPPGGPAGEEPPSPPGPPVTLAGADVGLTSSLRRRTDE